MWSAADGVEAFRAERLALTGVVSELLSRRHQRQLGTSGSALTRLASAGRGGGEHVCADAVEEGGIAVVGEAVSLGVGELV
jgi:hypothetical protein